MKKLNILHIITNLELGGAQKNALKIITALENSKYNKFFISAPRGLLCEEAKALNDVTVCFLSSLKRSISPLHDMIALGNIAGFIRRNKIDIVHTHSSKAGILGRWAAHLCGVKTIIHSIHGWSFNDHMHPLTRQLYIFLEKITAGITTSLVAVSKQDIEKGLDNKVGKPGQYQLIHYGIDLKTNCFEPEDTKKSILGCEMDSPVAGMIACLKPQKNPLDFVRMAAIISEKYPQVRFVEIGEGVLRQQMRAMIREKSLEDKVKLLGWRKDIETILPLVDVVVLTSLWEGLPMVLLEAMALAKPIVAYDAGGVSEILQDQINGYLIKQKDLGSLAEKTGYLLNNKTAARAMGQKGKELFEHSDFNVTAMMAKFEILYQSKT
ncbi:MAG: glycosyltransferase family 4 protein [Candidatus Omnitrophota bacterium]